jgi:hypothetical protein
MLVKLAAQDSLRGLYVVQLAQPAAASRRSEPAEREVLTASCFGGTTASSVATVMGLVGVELAPLRRCLEWGTRGMVPRKGGPLMDKHTLENLINGLKKARDACSSQLDIGALKELENAISLLEKLREHPQNAEAAETLKLRVLQAVAAVIRIVTDLRDWL